MVNVFRVIYRSIIAGPSSCSHNSFFILFIHSALSKIVLPFFPSACWFVLSTLPANVGKIFFCYIRMSCFVFVQSVGEVEYTDCIPAEGLTPPPNECPGYDTKHSVGEVPDMLGLWRMRSIPSLPLLQGPIWPGVVAPDRALSMG